MRPCKWMILKLASIIYTEISLAYLETIWKLVYTVCNDYAWGKCYILLLNWSGCTYTYSQVPDCPLYFNLSCQVAGTGFAITYSIVLFFPIFDQVPCESHLQKQNKQLHFPSPFPVPLSGATLRDFLSTHSQLKVKIVKLRFSGKGSMWSKLVIKKKKALNFLLSDLNETWKRAVHSSVDEKAKVTFRLALFMFETLSSCSL